MRRCAAGMAGVVLSLATAQARTGSPVVPAGDDTIRFSHARHEATACTTCHPTSAEQVRPRPPAIAGHSACRSCHQGADTGGGRDGTCAVCHRGPGAPRAAKRLPAALVFSHRIHAGAPDGCRTCHRTADRMRPASAQCMQCHRGWMQTQRCEACHPAHPDGRLITGLPAGELVPRGGHGGDDHGPGWNQGHGRVAARREARCRACHTRRSCDRCHRGVLRPLAIHPADWELAHAGPARAGLMSCDACHRDQTDCLGCHRETGVAASSERRPRNMRIHPEGYKGVHAADARRNLRACTGCHTEGDCIRCHGAGETGLGISPHGPGFARRCRLMRSRNPRPCLKCHTRQQLEALCP